MPSGGVTPAGGGTAFNGGTITQPLTISRGADANESLTIVGTSTANEPRLRVDYPHTSFVVGGDGTLDFDTDDGLQASFAAGGGTDAALSVSGAGGAASLNSTNGVLAGNPYLARLAVDGTIRTKAHAAPSDASLASGEAALWFDQTNGAAKLMVKAKTANGTVATAAIALA